MFGLFQKAISPNLIFKTLQKKIYKISKERVFMPKFTCNEIEIYYEIHGEGYPLVLIAGLGCDMSIWDPILDLLKRHFKIIIFDNRGVGRSSSPSQPYTISDMALDTWNLIAKLELHKPHVLGHSMGGVYFTRNGKIRSR
ncbi:MAG: hypothetical protein BGO14_02855 [Chlamydiales bacterium 38-26]|nr:MAG: hypothetical protein BGO14_02855 [Chlamydiales bacterium 38-26]